MSVGENITLISLFLICGGLWLYKSLSEKYQMDYEKKFMDQYENIIKQQQENNSPVTEFIPLTFEPEETENLLALCSQYISKWTPRYYLNLRFLKNYKPSVQTHYIGFRRLAPQYRPVKIQLIRCSEKYALIGAGDGFSGYVLERGWYGENEPYNIIGPIFNMYGKFYYKQSIQRINVDGIELSTSQPTTSHNLPLPRSLLPSIRPFRYRGSDQNPSYTPLDDPTR